MQRIQPSIDELLPIDEQKKMNWRMEDTHTATTRADQFESIAVACLWMKQQRRQQHSIALIELIVWIVDLMRRNHV